MSHSYKGSVGLGPLTKTYRDAPGPTLSGRYGGACRKLSIFISVYYQLLQRRKRHFNFSISCKDLVGRRFPARPSANHVPVVV